MVNDVIITRSIELNATPERVWEVLTHPAMTKQYYYNCEVNSDWTQGSLLHWRGIHDGREIEAEGKLIEIIPGRRIKYSGFDRLAAGDVSRTGDIHITHEILPKGNKTLLLTTIDHFEGDGTRAEYAATQWDFEIMPKLQALVESKL
jgi:uncharacterized protein YndB with AHSA1/START domain